MAPCVALMAWQRSLFSCFLIIAGFTLCVVDCANAAEAYISPPLIREMPLPSALLGVAQAHIPTPIRTSDQQALLAPLDDVRQRFDTLLQESNQIQDHHDITADASFQLASALATSDGFFLLSAHDAMRAPTILQVLREDASDFIIFAETADAVRLHHFAQDIFDEPHHIWPDLASGPIAPLSYHWPVRGIVSFAHKPDQEMSGHLTASFLDHRGSLHLSRADERLMLSFSIAPWRQHSLFETDAMLDYGSLRYQAISLLGHTSLPDPALWGQFYRLAPLEGGAPTHGHFSNFTLPD